MLGGCNSTTVVLNYLSQCLSQDKFMVLGLHKFVSTNLDTSLTLPAQGNTVEKQELKVDELEFNMIPQLICDIKALLTSFRP